MVIDLVTFKNNPIQSNPNNNNKKKKNVLTEIDFGNLGVFL